LVDLTFEQHSILRELGDNYNYSAFMKQLEEKKKEMNPAQKAGLKQRLELLQTFTRQTRSLPLAASRNTVVMREEERFSPGVITIIDLSDPFVDPALAGAIFEICIRLFQRASVDTGKVLVVDEAHKVLVTIFCKLLAYRTCSISRTQTVLLASRRHCYRWFASNDTCQCA
jgi:hypothetical protein